MSNIKRLMFALGLLLSATIGASLSCLAATPVTLKTDFEIATPTVKLSDLFNNIPTSIDREIAQAPPACKTAVYDEKVLDRLARLYRIEIDPHTPHQSITISSPCTYINSDSLRSMVAAKMRVSQNSPKHTYEVILDRRSQYVELPTNNPEDIALDNFFYEASSKMFRANVSAMIDKSPHIKPVSGRILVKRSVPVLSHRLEKGTVIAANDLDWLDIMEERITTDVITEPRQIIGRELRRDLPEGEIVRSRDIMPARFVARGSLVTLKIETPYILITAQGKAQQDGTQGETIRVVNTQSNRLIEGIVVAPGVVEIKTTRKVALAE